ncbi:MAG: L,D-transpeptidase [Bacteroidota bacterium]|nr:L,D-transpeptidase [Bacteroidota bacterium]
MKAAMYFSFLGMASVALTSFKKTVPLNMHYATSNTYKVLIVKNTYELRVFDSSGEWIVTYPVVFGNKDLGDKMMQGDRKTPEGIFHIRNKRKHEKWNAFILLDYPTEESYRKFQERKSEGLIPVNAEIGGGIGIHGTWPHEDYAIDQYQNWTEGCISTKNDYIQEIFRLLPVGTQVEIRR